MRAAALIAPDADLTALHVFELPFEGKLWLAGVPDDEINRFRAQARSQALRRVLDLAAGLGEIGARFRPQVEQGPAARGVLETADQLDADLIVMGRHGKSVAETFFIGSVTRHVLADARCDVLITPA
jgi:CPA2 family monovalent cation:H+ antiporter-2